MQVMSEISDKANLIVSLQTTIFDRNKLKTNYMAGWF